jgi:tetratricopeptide (TPR) repeat protein
MNRPREFRILISMPLGESKNHLLAMNAGNARRVLGVALLAFLFFWAGPVAGAPSDVLFQDGAKAYRAGDYAQAAQAFRRAAALQPASGTLQNLGNAEWQAGQAGTAIVAWEQALWLDPFNQAARNNLRFARKVAQLEAPDLTWYEVISTWLPASWWAWTAGLSLWLAVGMGLLPGIFRRRRAAWHQAVAAMALMVFLLSVPANLGVHTRSHIAFVVQKDTPLRLTPTDESQVLTRLAPGTAVRWERSRGNFLLVRAGSDAASGWIQRESLRVIRQW